MSPSHRTVTEMTNNDDLRAFSTNPTGLKREHDRADCQERDCAFGKWAEVSEWITARIGSVLQGPDVLGDSRHITIWNRRRAEHRHCSGAVADRFRDLNRRGQQQRRRVLTQEHATLASSLVARRTLLAVDRPTSRHRSRIRVDARDRRTTRPQLCHILVECGDHIRRIRRGGCDALESAALRSASVRSSA